MRAMLLGRIRIYEELRAQVRRILDAGLEPTHLDTHKHTHLLPPVLDAVARFPKSTGFPGCAARSICRSRPLRPGVAWAQASHQPELWAGARPFRARADAPRLPLHGSLRGIPDHRPLCAARIGASDSRLPEGSTEFMCHPGFCGDELRAARTRLKESREHELRALTSPEVRTALD